MSIELLSYNASIAFGAGPAAENFRIDPVYGAKQPERFLTPIEIASERNALLRKPPLRRTFLVGSFSNRIDPATGMIMQQDREFIEGLHQLHERQGIECYSSFKRERYGRLGITDADATALDKLAILTSHVLTVLPNSSLSHGTWEEIRYGGAVKRSFLFLFREEISEFPFQQEIRSIIANLSVHPIIMFLSFRNNADLQEQLAEVWNPIVHLETSDEEWKRVVDYAGHLAK